MFLAVKGNWRSYMNFIGISVILSLICSNLMLVNKSSVAAFTSKNQFVLNKTAFKFVQSLLKVGHKDSNDTV